MPSFFAPLQQENIRTQVFAGLVANSRVVIVLRTLKETLPGEFGQGCLLTMDTKIYLKQVFVEKEHFDALIKSIIKSITITIIKSNFSIDRREDY